MNSGKLEWLLNTASVVFLGGVSVFVYMIVLQVYHRKELELVNISVVYFTSSSIMGGMRLIYKTYLLLDLYTFESEKFYTIYGGFCILFVAFNTLSKKIKGK